MLSRIDSFGEWLRLLWRGLLHLENAIVFLAALVLTALIFVEVVARYVFNTSFTGINELASYTALWLYFVSVAAAAAKGVHISASVTDFFIKDRNKELRVLFLTDLLSIGATAWMAVWAWQYSLWALGMHMMSLELGVPLGWITIIIPIGLSLLTLYFVADAINHVREFLTGEKP